MSEVKRYTSYVDTDRCRLAEEPDGEYVTFADYDALAACDRDGEGER